jgi:exosortase/archaeosortase family protein
MFILLVMHFAWRFWANQLHYHLFGIDMEPGGAYAALVRIVVNQSAWFITHVLNIDFNLNGNTFLFANNNFVTVNSSCSGLKQFYQLIGLMIFYPGPWRKKLWFIPLGVVVMHLTNLFRIIGIAVVLQHIPEHWKWLHDWAFRPFFYVVMFSMWVWWTEKLAKKKKETVQKKNLLTDG